MRDMVASLFDEREVALFEGGKEVAQELLALPFDHIYFTGSPDVGKIVMKAAAEHLASVTLELGGKSPAIVDDTADVLDAASKIAWGKFTNVGQTCIAPDYVLVHERAHDLLVDALQHNIRRFYGETPADRHSTPDYARIVNTKHYERLHHLYNDALHRGARTVAGGATDADDRYIAPTLLADVPSDADIMEEEIFGPLLPIIPFRTVDEAIDRVNALPNPLALYLFTDSPATEQAVLSRTTAGTTAINDTLLQFFNPNLPFGGAGYSGIGKGSGYFGFKEFSNERAVLRRTAGSAIIKQLYPPYGPTSRKVIDWLVKYL
jgi:aldehyde dehydrogenase (NAD+)